jgi:hypothetical protein
LVVAVGHRLRNKGWIHPVLDVPMKLRSTVHVIGWLIIAPLVIILIGRITLVVIGVALIVIGGAIRRTIVAVPLVIPGILLCAASIGSRCIAIGACTGITTCRRHSIGRHGDSSFYYPCGDPS